MKFLWCDTETTGIETTNAAPFQIAFIFVATVNGNRTEEEKVFYLNPFEISGIEYNEDAGKVHGYSKAAIESFEPASKVVPEIAEWLNKCFNFIQPEKLMIAGYNVIFDYNHLKELFSKCGYDFAKYIHPQILDVFSQVKEAGKHRVLPYLENRKLTTIAKYLKVDLSNAHDALGDITATREVAKSLAHMGIPLK